MRGSGVRILFAAPILKSWTMLRGGVRRVLFEPLTDKRPVRQIGAANLIGRRPTPKGEARKRRVILFAAPDPLLVKSDDVGVLT